jgi:hypothetical protein
MGEDLILEPRAITLETVRAHKDADIDLQLTAAQQQAQRMLAVPGLYKTSLEQMACELALEVEEPGIIFARYGYTDETAVGLLETPGFASTLERISKEVRESGLSFKTKARAQAEQLLATSFEIATDPQQNTAVRADLVKWTCKMAGYEPKTNDEKGAGNGGLNLSITFAGQAPQVVTHQPLTIEGESA